ncbi:hypothetical protein NADFUDRAFT_43673 [Nadsonia fulvescens var. elongata DSM 6958]|uniref:Uncharacterized protein n=1 Tax=Nadsonia fulvescens var. elongata DSM 6958 TaxID=857566 RepID=A0A1E3PGQ2_9ASCO|nr:hypothetical protein NADFUDRAFT_43673 [Nadsonia fulvescens var. elongata DSM 6958]
MTSRKLTDDSGVSGSFHSEVYTIKRQKIDVSDSTAISLPSDFFDEKAAHNYEANHAKKASTDGKRELNDGIEDELTQFEREIQETSVFHDDNSISLPKAGISASVEPVVFQSQDKGDVQTDSSGVKQDETLKSEEENQDFQDTILDQIEEQNEFYLKVDQLKRLRQAKLMSVKGNNLLKTENITDNRLNLNNNLNESVSTDYGGNSDSDSDSGSNSNGEDLWRSRGI